PAVQTICAPHVVPSGALPISVQTGAPVAHAIAAARQTFPEVHNAPWLHAMHPPAPLHTLSPWHIWPAGAFPDSTHVNDAPVGAQTTWPVRQPPAIRQAAPSEVHNFECDDPA